MPAFRRVRRGAAPRRKAPTKADQALRMVRSIKRSMEIKRVCYDYINNSGTDPINGTGIAVGLTPLALGTDGFDRVGEKISPKYITLRWTLGRTAQDGLFRVVVVRHRQSQLSTSLILQSASASAEPLAPYNTEYKTNFTVLVDKYFTLDTYHPVQSFVKRIRLGGSIHYNEGSTVPLRGGITMYVYSNLSANYPTFASSWDVAYTDN